MALRLNNYSRIWYKWGSKKKKDLRTKLDILNKGNKKSFNLPT